MGDGDLIPTGYHSRKTDPAYAKKIREGGKRADAMRAHREQHHATLEVPVAETQLNEDLKKLGNA